MLKARVLLESTIIIENWCVLATGHQYDEWLLDMLLYGFPLQYTGPAFETHSVENHSSAKAFPDFTSYAIFRKKYANTQF